jgi:hypothetical protein
MPPDIDPNFVENLFSARIYGHVEKLAGAGNATLGRFVSVGLWFASQKETTWACGDTWNCTMIACNGFGRCIRWEGQSIRLVSYLPSCGNNRSIMLSRGIQAWQEVCREGHNRGYCVLSVNARLPRV